LRLPLLDYNERPLIQRRVERLNFAGFFVFPLLLEHRYKSRLKELRFFCRLPASVPK